jgi:hypothetical protein
MDMIGLNICRIESEHFESRFQRDSRHVPEQEQERSYQ